MGPYRTTSLKSGEQCLRISIYTLASKIKNDILRMTQVNRGTPELQIQVYIIGLGIDPDQDGQSCQSRIAQEGFGVYLQRCPHRVKTLIRDARSPRSPRLRRFVLFGWEFVRAEDGLLQGKESSQIVVTSCDPMD